MHTAQELEDTVIEKAKAILERRFNESRKVIFEKPSLVADFLRFKYQSYEHEVFGVLFLNNKHHLISCEELFRGTIDAAAVYPREVAKTALHFNAKAVIFFHNHPSGDHEPSQADKAITEKVRQALEVLNITVLDHFVVGTGGTTSFVERGWL